MTRFAKEVRQDVVVGRVSVSRRTAMNVIIGTAAMSISATPVSAGELPRTAQLEQLIRAFKAANRGLVEAVELSDRVERVPSKPVRVLGGQTEPVTLVLPGRTEAIPATDWYFYSGDDIRKNLKLELEKAPASEHAAIKDRYDGYLVDLTKQQQANKKAAAEKRKAEAATMRAYRAEQRAVRAILEYEPSSGSEAVQLLEFVASEDAFADDDALRTVMENAARALRMAA